jgi:hypothetical protein
MKLLSAGLSTLLFAFSVWAEGLSWTDPNPEKKCKGVFCSEATIHQGETTVAGVKLYLLHSLIMLSPRRTAGETVNIKIVYETTDHLKRESFKERAPIKIYEDKERYCDAEVALADKGATSVLAIDVTELDAKGEVVLTHEFR